MADKETDSVAEVSDDLEQSFWELMGDEAKQGLPELAAKQREEFELLRDGASSGISGTFGKPTIFEAPGRDIASTPANIGIEADPEAWAQDAAIQDNSRLGKVDAVPLKFEEAFGRLDEDGDGIISQHEIEVAMSNPAITGSTAQLVEVLKIYREDLRGLSNDEFGPETGISREDMKAFEGLLKKDREHRSDEENALVDGMQKRLNHSRAVLDNVERHAFPSLDHPEENIKPEAVRQGCYGDCYFIASVAAFANTAEGKQAIKNMIKVNSDGTYTVTFPGDPDNPVTVSAPTDSELSYYTEGTENGLWPAILEKAYGTYTDRLNIISEEGIEEGSNSGAAMKLLTGKDVKTDSISDSRSSIDETDRKLTAAVRNGKPMTAGIDHWAHHDPGLQNSHRYSVLDYDPTTKMVTVRNPNGYNELEDKDGNILDDHHDGIFKMPLDQFCRNFSRVYYGQ